MQKSTLFYIYVQLKLINLIFYCINKIITSIYITKYRAYQARPFFLGVGGGNEGLKYPTYLSLFIKF